LLILRASGWEVPEYSPKATCSTSDDVAVRETLHNLECPLKNSSESNLCDVELQKQLHTSLECIKQATHEKVSPNDVQESMERCEEQKKKMEGEAKNKFTESKKLMSIIKNSKSSYAAALSKRQKLNKKWEDFGIDFADKYGSSRAEKY